MNTGKCCTVRNYMGTIVFTYILQCLLSEPQLVILAPGSFFFELHPPFYKRNWSCYTFIFGYKLELNDSTLSLD
jgi:hypothetical protein